MTHGPIAAGALALAALCSAGPEARANGQFPAADYLMVHPADASRIVARTTFGLLLSADTGHTWDWICESGVGYANYAPPLTVTQDGTLVLGLLTGIGVAHGDACAWGFAQGGSFGLFVVDVTLDRSAPARSLVVTAQGGLNVSAVWSAPDDGGTFTQQGVTLPSGFLAKTLDVAPSDPQRIYVSGSDTSTGMLIGRVARSKNGGQDWELFDVPGSAAGTAPYIGAIDPLDADTLYLRLDGAPGAVLRSTDGGQDWQTIFTAGLGFLKGFALSPDGATLAVGGDLDGIWRGPASGSSFEQVSTVRARCLTWTAAGLYACADEAIDGFTLGLSSDEGASFDPLLHLPCIRGPLDCAADTSVGMTCPGEWPALQTTINASACGQGGGGGAGGVGGSGGEGPTGGTGGASSGEGGSGGAGAATSSSSGVPIPGVVDDGCACSGAVGGQGPAGSTAWLAAAVVACGALVRRERRGRLTS